MVLLRNRDDALDAVQEAFVDAYQALDRFDADRPFYPWLYVILRNRCYKLLGQRTRDAAVQSLQASSPSLLHSAESSEAAERVEQALLELEPEDREIITLRHLDGHSYAELAERLEIPLGTVMSRLYHARRRLRQKLD